jgi:hypothetical protein
VTVFYLCASKHWCASDEKILQSEWPFARCSSCKAFIAVQEPRYDPPDLREMPCVIFLGIQGQASSSSPLPNASHQLPAPPDFSEKVASYLGEDFDLHVQHQTLITEEKSQAALYEILQQYGYTFLRRDATFGAFKAPSNSYESDETVPEPGIRQHGTYGNFQASCRLND